MRDSTYYLRIVGRDVGSTDKKEEDNVLLRIWKGDNNDDEQLDLEAEIEDLNVPEHERVVQLHTSNHDPHYLVQLTPDDLDALYEEMGVEHGIVNRIIRYSAASKKPQYEINCIIDQIAELLDSLEAE